MTSDGSRRRGRGRIWAAMAVFVLLSGVAAAIAFHQVFLRDLPDPRSIADYRPGLSSEVYDREGRPIGEFYRERRRLVRFEEVPRHVVDAFIAAEDSKFYEHEGIDFQGILRAAWANLLAGGEIKQGGSTITQQMVKGLLLSPERTYTRKVREMILARRIEQRFTKQEILYLYLNQIYFGNGAYGIAEAARSYFNKSVGELEVSEAAQLAGLPKAPSRYSPMRNPEEAEHRRLYVLERMRDEGLIDEAAYQGAVAEKPEFVDGSRPDAFAASAYFTEEVRRYLFDVLGGEAVLEGGLRIETSLDLELQRVAVEAVQSGLVGLDRRNGYRGPRRKVAADAIEAEVERVAEENGEEALGDPLLGPLLGVVTAVDAAAKTASVALGGELRGTVHLEDVDWARPLDPDTRPKAVTSIAKIFSPGDVTHFAVLPPEEGAALDLEAPLRLALHQEPKVQGGLLALSVETGEVLAMVGGYDFEKSQFNRATQSRRQPGSAFKPLVYGAALSLEAEGVPRYTPASIVHDRPKVYRDHRSGFVWKPKNYGREFYGPITLRTALAKSVNNAAVHLADEVGVGAVMRYAKRLGIRSPLDRSLGLALGTSGVSLLELTRAYAVFPNGGRRVVPVFLQRVLDREGNVLLEGVPLGDPLVEGEAPDAPEGEVEGELDVAAGPEGEASEPIEFVEAESLAPEDESDQLIPPEQAYLMVDMLRAVVNEGTGRRAAKLGAPLGGKTGTTNDQADAWFVGFSPAVATGVWVGFDEVRFLGSGETGSKAALPIWVDFMRTAIREVPKDAYEVPRNRIVFTRIDRDTGLLASRGTQKTVFQPFIAGSQPTRTADSARRDDRARRDLQQDSFDTDPGQSLDFDSF